MLFALLIRREVKNICRFLLKFCTALCIKYFSMDSMKPTCVRLYRMQRKIMKTKTLSIFFFLLTSAPFLHAENTEEQTIPGTTSTDIVIVKESTAEIMSHPAMSRDIENPESYRGQRKYTGDKVQNPDSMAQAFSPDVGFDYPQRARSLSGISFTAVTLSDTGAFPPDSMGAVGPTQYLAACNNRIRSFSKDTGAQDNVIDLSTDSFFASVLHVNAFTSDPQIRYDRLTDRWFVTMISVTTDNSPNQILIAVSSEGIISNTTIWSFYSFTPDNLSPTRPSNDFADFPTLGIDSHALYIGVNVFDNNTGNYINSDAFVIEKWPLVNSGMLVVTTFRNLVDTSTFVGMISPQGVDVFDTQDTGGYFIGVDASTAGRLILRRVFNPDNSPTLSGNIFINVFPWQYPLLVPHKGNLNGTAGNLDGLDDRLSQSHVRDRHLYTCHAEGTSNTGLWSGTITRNSCRWYDIYIGNPSSPRLIQSSVLHDGSTSSTPLYYWMPSIMTNGLHDFVLGCSVAGANNYIRAAYVSHYWNDPANYFGAPNYYASSQTAYNPSGDPGGSEGRRWGDYSRISLDPSDNMTLWCIQEYCNATNSYGCRVVRIPSPPPPQTISVSPSNVGRGSNILLTITGNDLTNGKAFYDGGPGFSRRLAATIEEVQVNAISSVSRTQITLLIDTTNTPIGTKSIIITNPDGQTVVAKNLLQVN